MELTFKIKDTIELYFINNKMSSLGFDTFPYKLFNKECFIRWNMKSKCCYYCKMKEQDIHFNCEDLLSGKCNEYLN